MTMEETTAVTATSVIEKEEYSADPFADTANGFTDDPTHALSSTTTSNGIAVGDGTPINVTGSNDESNNDDFGDFNTADIDVANEAMRENGGTAQQPHEVDPFEAEDTNSSSMVVDGIETNQDRNSLIDFNNATVSESFPPNSSTDIKLNLSLESSNNAETTNGAEKPTPENNDSCGEYIDIAVTSSSNELPAVSPEGDVHSLSLTHSHLENANGTETHNFDDFDPATAQPTVPNADNDDFGDFGTATSRAEMTQQSLPTEAADGGHYTTDFGNFDTTIQNPLASSETHEIVPEQVNDDDDFGDFDMARPSPTTINQNDISINDNDDTDFGDFDAAEPPPNDFVTNETIYVNNEIIADNDDDDDDFGDFDEAPATSNINNEVELNRTREELTDPPIDKVRLSSSEVDPMLHKIRSAFSKIFNKYIDENAISEKADYFDSKPIPCFEENEIVTISSVLEKLETELPASDNIHNRDVNRLVESLFESEMKDASPVPTASRYVKSRNTAPPLTKCPLSGRLFASNIDRMTKSVVHGSRVNRSTNGSDSQSIASQNHAETITAPSDQAKALIERIPDLSFMLSSTLSVTSSKSNNV